VASHRRSKQPSRARVTVLTVTAATAVALTSQAAQAAPKSKQEAVKVKVDKLYHDAERTTEEYDGAKERQKKLEKAVSDLLNQVARGQGDLNVLRDLLGSVANSQYRSGGIDPSVQLFLSSNPNDYLDKASTLEQLSSQQVEALRKIQDKQRVLAQERQEATAKLKDLQETRKVLSKRKRQVQSKLAEAQKLLNTLTAQQKRALAEQQARASLTSAERALGGGAAASARAAEAFAAAKTKIGSPYVWGATGPSSFDCSGFTSWAYAQAGVSIPRTSQAQANAGRRIYSESQLKVGDLVLFFGDLSHVALYAGHGQVLHAPHTGSSVRFESISDMPFQFGVRI
jgi:cell wall-associated NlpC family hydrolase